MVKQLSLKKNSGGKIVKILDNVLKRRMIELGIVKGKEIKILRKAPFGSTYYVKVGNHIIGMRSEELATIQVV